MNRFMLIMFVLLVLNQLFLPSFALRNNAFGGSKYSSSGHSLRNNGPKTVSGTSSGIPVQNTIRRNLGISAWGIIAVIIMSILTGLGLYYLSICYPILCKKQRKYDMMGLPSVA